MKLLRFRTQAMLIEFTQYHRETGIFLPVSILLEKTQTQRILSTISIQPFHIPGSFSGLDLNIAITVTATMQINFPDVVPKSCHAEIYILKKLLHEGLY